MTGKISVVIEQDEHGCYAWCPELKGCQSQGDTVEETLANIREAIELYLETLTDEERSAALSREILTTAIEVHAYAAALNRGGGRSDALENRLRLVAVQGQSSDLRKRPPPGGGSIPWWRDATPENRQAGSGSHRGSFQRADSSRVTPDPRHSPCPPTCYIKG